ncbi:pilus assembly protein TadG-related protein (plasmid) [Isosphaeraceae bacterium EP7]
MQLNPREAAGRTHRGVEAKPAGSALRRRAPRRGVVAVQCVLALSVLMGAAALIVDGGILMSERRHVQAAADAAALAGAIDLYKNYATHAGVDTPGSAADSARAIALANYPADPANVAVTVSIPPQSAESSSYNGKAGYVEVRVTYAQERGLSTIWSSSRIPVTGRAIARGRWAPSDFAILTLAPTGAAEFNVSGGGSVEVNGGSIMVNSNDVGALKNSGGGSVKASSIEVVGDYTGGGSFSTTPKTGSMPIEDPLKLLAAPAIPSPGNFTMTSIPNSNAKRYTLSPGAYDGNGGTPMPSFKSGDEVIFKQADANSAGGIYYLYKGLKTSGVTMTMGDGTGGMMFYNAGVGSSDGFSITGNASGTVNLSGLDGTASSTRAYKGLIYYQARGSTQDVSVAGNGSFTLRGTFYAPSAALKVTGNSSTPPSTIGSQYIANSLTVSGGGAVVLDYNSGLVAPARFIGLVE